MIRRYDFIFIAILSAVGLGVALVSQHFFALKPCAWCVFQRLLLILLLLSAIIGQLAKYYEKSVIAIFSRLIIMAVAWGGVLAAWYQHTVAAKLFSCDLSFADHVMTQSGLESALPWLFGIYASCMEASVSVLGLAYAVWALLFFAFIALLAVLPLVNLKPQP